jgi:hypothetical protein
MGQVERCNPLLFTNMNRRIKETLAGTRRGCTSLALLSRVLLLLLLLLCSSVYRC